MPAGSRKAPPIERRLESRERDIAISSSSISTDTPPLPWPLGRNPCPLNEQESAQCHSAKVQSSYVANVRFLRSGRQLVSVGGTDATLLQWRLQ